MSVFCFCWFSNIYFILSQAQTKNCQKTASKNNPLSQLLLGCNGVSRRHKQTNKQTDGNRKSTTESAQWADSVKRTYNIEHWILQINFERWTLNYWNIILNFKHWILDNECGTMNIKYWTMNIEHYPNNIKHWILNI